MRMRAEADGDVYLPNPAPTRRVQHVLVAMEPSLGGSSVDETRTRIEKGFRNFLTSPEDFIVHACARRYLCGPGEAYHLTDLSKGAMLVAHAGHARRARYDRWYGLFMEELDLVAEPDATIIALGRAVAAQLERRAFERPVRRVLHYSGQAAKARNEAVAGHEAAFEAFTAAFTEETLLEEAAAVLAASAVPDEVREEAMARLQRSTLSPSRKKLAFAYKTAFEEARAEAAAWEEE